MVIEIKLVLLHLKKANRKMQVVRKKKKFIKNDTHSAYNYP